MENSKQSQLNAFHNKRVFFEKTPDVLLDNIARLEGMLERYRNAPGQAADIMLFYEGILRILKMAYMYIQQTQFIHDRNTTLESYVRFLAEENQKLQKRINEFETLTSLKLDNRLEEIMNHAEVYVDQTLSGKKSNNT